MKGYKKASMSDKSRSMPKGYSSGGRMQGGSMAPNGNRPKGSMMAHKAC